MEHVWTQAEAQDAAIELLQRMIATPSVSRDEAQVATLIEQYLVEAVGSSDVHRHGNNIWSVAPAYDEHRPTLLLNAHLDTVRPTASWQRDPFQPTLEGDRLYGLGANDDGASLVTLLHVYLRLRQTNQSYNLIFLASAEEEVSGRGGIESVMPLLPRVDVALVGEPTGMRAAVAEKGLVVLDGVARGVSGHAARNEGVNAIYIAMEAIERLRSFRFEQESTTLGPVKISVTQVHAGTAHNVVPDECTFVVDVRTTDVYTNQQVIERLQRLVSPVTLTPRSTRLQPSGIAATHPLVKRIVEIGRPTFGSPTLSDQALLACPSVKIGPGDSARSHTADEFICLSEIRQAVALYESILDGLAL